MKKTEELNALVRKQYDTIRNYNNGTINYITYRDAIRDITNKIKEIRRGI